MRGNPVIKRVYKWLAEPDWQGRKPLHEMQKLYGHRARAQCGLGVAQRLLRHESRVTTEDFCSGPESVEGVKGSLGFE